MVRPFQQPPSSPVSYRSGVRLSRFYLPQMLQKNWGRIVFISSESGVNIPVEMVHYGVTKTAQIALARGLAETTAGTGVTVNSVLPGPTRSEGVEQFVEDLAKGQGTEAATVEAEFFRTARPSSLLKRFATPEEVAAMLEGKMSNDPAARAEAARPRLAKASTLVRFVLIGHEKLYQQETSRGRIGIGITLRDGAPAVVRMAERLGLPASRY